MRTLRCLTVLLVGSFSQLGAQQPTSQQRAELIAARDAVWRAWFTGDSLGLIAALPEQMVGMGKHRAAIITEAMEFRRGGGRLVSIAFTDDEFLVQDGVALVLSNYRVVTSNNGTEGVMAGKAIEVFTLRGGRWLNPYWHLDDQ